MRNGRGSSSAVTAPGGKAPLEPGAKPAGGCRPPGWPGGDAPAPGRRYSVWSGEPISRGRSLEGHLRGMCQPESLIEQTYWHAAGRAWAVGEVARRCEDPLERHALEELQAAEWQRMELARRALADVWGRILPPAETAPTAGRGPERG